VIGSWRVAQHDTEERLVNREAVRVVKGKAVTNGDGKVSVESKTKTEVENGQDQETKTKSEGTTGAFDVPFLGVRSMKTLSSSCN
jgi:hypothetical protein